MANIIAFANQKGGVGKTTMTMQVGAYLTKQGKKVLFVDMDAQGNLTQYLGINTNDENTISELLTDNCTIDECIFNTKYGDVICSDINLSAIEMELNSAVGRELILKEKLQPLMGGYDFVLIDCSPSLNVFTYNAFSCANSVSVVLNPELFAIKGIAQLIRSVGMIKKINQDLKINGLMLNKVGQKTNARDFCIEQIEKICAEQKLYLYSSKISNAAALVETTLQKVDIADLQKNKKIQQEFEFLGQEFLKVTC